MEISVSPAQLCCKLKTALKIESIKNKKKIKRTLNTEMSLLSPSKK